MNTKIIIAATVAALSLATTAFAGEGQGGYQATTDSFSAATPSVQTGAQQYPSDGTQVIARFDNTTLPENGQNGAVQTANSLPRGFENGTLAFTQAQSINRWFAQQAEHRFAQQQQTVAAHSRG